MKSRQRGRSTRRRTNAEIAEGQRYADSHSAPAGRTLAQAQAELVLGSSARAIALGLGLGFVGAVAAGSVLRGSLYGVSTMDPIAYGGVALLLVVTSLTATFLPARRAARVDPLRALRCE